jgi:hypothetical protein
MDDSSQQNIAPEQLSALGEQIYFSKKDELERTSMGQFAVIEVESKEVFVDPDKLTAIQKAQARYPNKLFYIVQIGNLRPTPSSEVNEVKKYGWAI